MQNNSEKVRHSMAGGGASSIRALGAPTASRVNQHRGTFGVTRKSGVGDTGVQIHKNYCLVVAVLS